MTECNEINTNPFVFIDFGVGEEKVGRVVIELFANIAPRTVENFRALCTGEKSPGKLTKNLCYKGCILHRVVSQFMIQGGDIVNGDGSSGESIYGPQFDDENFDLKHEEEGIVSMANAGPNTNSSQFFITTVPCIHLDGTNVAFGKVRRGFGIIKEISELKSDDGRPFLKCYITNCGELKNGDDWCIGDKDITDDKYPPWPEDCDAIPTLKTFKEYESIITKIKNAGNYHFSTKNFVESDRKYRKALRYIEYSNTLKLAGPSLDTKLINNIKLIPLLNLAAVKLKRKDFKEAKNVCDQALSIDAKSSKAFYRRGQAQMGLNEYTKALKDLKTALKLCPNDKRIVEEIKIVQATIDKYLVHEKLIFSKMLEV